MNWVSKKQLVPKPDRQYTRDQPIVLNQWAEKRKSDLNENRIQLYNTRKDQFVISHEMRKT